MGPRSQPVAVAIVLATALLFLTGEPSRAHDGLAGQIETLSLQIEKDPTHAELLVRRADLYRLARQWQLAAADLDRAAGLEPDLASIDLARAHLLADTGRMQAAVTAASRVLERQPDHVDALLVRARARVRLGLVREAVADFTRVLDARPLSDVYVERARAASSARGASLEPSLRGLDEGIRRLGPLVTLELEAIEIELRLTRYEAALARLDRVSAQAERRDTWLARRGEILERAGRADDARAAYRAALDAATSASARARQSPASAALVARLRARLTRLASLSNAHTPHEGAP